MDNWSELRTAYKLAQLKTLSATAIELNVHRSTVMRHIDSLEQQLKIKLFQRNDKGYIPTEAGIELMKLGEITEQHFAQFKNKQQNTEQLVEGTLTLTCVSEMAKVLMPAIAEYQRTYPLAKVDIIGDIRNFNLQYGEADIAIRTGKKPNTLDNIVLRLTEFELCLAAHKQYLERCGVPTLANLQQHRFVAFKERISHLPWNEWIQENVPEQIFLTASDGQGLFNAVVAGIGIGVMTKDAVRTNPDLVEVNLNQQWHIPMWLLVHRDMINIPKIRKFVDLLKSQKDWSFSLADQY